MHRLKRSFRSSYIAVFNNKSIRTVVVNRVSADKEKEEITKLKSWKEIPGPTTFPIVGQMFSFLPGGLYNEISREQLMKKLYTNFGPIVRIQPAFAPTIIILYDPESIALILRSENWLPMRPGLISLDYFRKQYRKPKNGTRRPTGLLTEHGKEWKEFRSTVNPVMMQPKTIKLYSSALDEVALDMIARMRSNRDENNSIKGKFDVEMNLWALESIGLVALGERLDCFNPNLAEDSPARTLIRCVHDFFKVTDQLDFKPSIWRYYPTKAFKEGMKVYEQHAETAKYFIDKAVEVLKHKDKNTKEEKSILEKLLEIDEEAAYIMANDMLVGGVDTVAHSMILTMYFLAINPEKQNKLREEILSGHEKKTFLKACLKESFRMMPVVGENMRRTSKEYNLMGYRVPKNMDISFAHYFLSTSESQFPRAKEYLPERWIVKSEDPIYYKNAHPFAYSPFGFGVRSCIGRRIAEMELEIFLARIIENFHIEWFGEHPNIKSMTLNYVTGPFNFKFKDV